MTKLKRGVVLTRTGVQSVLTGTGRNAAYYRLNHIGTRMLDLMLEGVGDDAIALQLATEFEVSPSRVRSDLDQIVSSLVAEKLIQRN